MTADRSAEEAIVSNTEIAEIFSKLSPRQKTSATGVVFSKIIPLLEENGRIEAEKALEACFPGKTPTEARRKLNTQFTSRPLYDASGRIVLGLRVTRPRKGMRVECYFVQDRYLKILKQVRTMRPHARTAARSIEMTGP